MKRKIRYFPFVASSLVLVGCSGQPDYSNEFKELHDQLAQLNESIVQLNKQQTELQQGFDQLLARSQSSFSADATLAGDSEATLLAGAGSDSYVDLRSLSKAELIEQYHQLRARYADRTEFEYNDPEVSAYIELGLENPQQLIELYATNPHDHYLLFALFDSIDATSAPLLLNYVDSNYDMLQLAAHKGLVQVYPEKFTSILVNRLTMGEDPPPSLIEEAITYLSDEQMELVVNYAVNGVNKNATLAALHEIGYEDLEAVALQAYESELRADRIMEYDLVMISYELARLGNREGLLNFHRHYVSGVEPDIQWGRLIALLFQDAVSEPDFEQNVSNAKFNEVSSKWYF